MSKYFTLFIAFFVLSPSVAFAFDLPTENCPAPVTIFTFDDVNAEIICGANWQLSASGETIISTTEHYWWQFYDNALIMDENSPYPPEDPETSENIDVGTTVIDNNFTPIIGFWEQFEVSSFDLQSDLFDSMVAFANSSGFVVVGIVIALFAILYIFKLIRRYVRG